MLEFNLSSGTTTVTGVISGSGSLTQNNSSVVVLTGSDTYTGLTTIGSGTLQIGNGGNTGSINNTSGITGNGTLAYDLSTPTTLAVSVTGGLSLMQAGSGVLTITSSETYTGSTIIASGATLQLGNGGSINSTNTISDSGTVAFDYSSAATFSKNIGGPGGLMQMTSTLLKITGNDSYTGPTTISAGTIQLGNSFALGNSSTVSFGSSSAVLDLDSYSATIGPWPQR